MSLSKQIIYGSLENISAYLSQKAPLEEVDEYGYTPLVQCAIVNSLEKADLLLQAGADPNFFDLTGRTALHWAADNNNLELCRLLLEYKADANAYTRAGQPVLVMPFLRGYDAIKQLLYDFGADLNFAQDFISAKTLGHRFSLEGRVDLVDNCGTFFEIEFEGFYLQFSLAIIARSLIDFVKNYGGKHLRPYFEPLKHIIKALQVANELLSYQHYLVDAQQHARRINNLLNQSPLIIPVAYEGHAITFIKFGRWLIRCDRGEFGRKQGTVIIYKMPESHLLSKGLIKKLMYKRQDKFYIEQGLIEQLKLQTVNHLPLSPQSAGNCAWANVEAVVPAAMFLLLMEIAKQEHRIDIEGSKEKALFFYHEWQEWDKSRALDFCSQSFYQSNPARKASKAAILAAVLFQTCQYAEKLDQPKAEKILSVLADPDYLYILKSYVQVFKEDKKSTLLKNLLLFLDEHGFDSKSLAEGEIK